MSYLIIEYNLILISIRAVRRYFLSSPFTDHASPITALTSFPVFPALAQSVSFHSVFLDTRSFGVHHKRYRAGYGSIVYTSRP